MSAGWRASYKTLAGVMTGLTVVFLFAFEETKFVPVLRGCAPNVPGDDSDVIELIETGSRARVAHKAVVFEVENKDQIHVPTPAPAWKPFPRYLRLQLVTPTHESYWRTLCEPFHVWWFPHVVFTYIEFASGICWVVVVASVVSIVFSKPPYNFNSAQIGYMSAGPFIGSIFGSIYGGYLVDKTIVWFSRRNKGLFEPEMRLYLFPLPAILMSVGLAIFGVTADRVCVCRFVAASRS